MSRYHSYFNSAAAILSEYRGGEPFSSFIKKYFAANKKFGAKDRKQVSHLCYCYFRLGKAGASLSNEERILAGLLLCSDKPDEILAALKPEWEEKVSLGLDEKCLLISRSFGKPFTMLSVFPWKQELSEGIDHEKFCTSFFTQPRLFVRIRPGKEEKVKQKLAETGFVFEPISANCLALENSAKVDVVIEPNKDAVVQDYNSQRVSEFFPVSRGPSYRVWDCCAASGGKSIMLYDMNPGIDLEVSDVRESILVNLRKRFSEAGISNYKSFVADLALGSPRISQGYDFILADVPCSGSGTWGRTPEQLFYFDEKKTAAYTALQQSILVNVCPHLLPGGYLLYITCSVFRKENEENVAFIKEKFHLAVEKMEVLKGYDHKADTMFAALLRKPLQFQ